MQQLSHAGRTRPVIASVFVCVCVSLRGCGRQHILLCLRERSRVCLENWLVAVRPFFCCRSDSRLIGRMRGVESSRSSCRGSITQQPNTHASFGSLRRLVCVECIVLYISKISYSRRPPVFLSNEQHDALNHTEKPAAHVVSPQCIRSCKCRVCEVCVVCVFTCRNRTWKWQTHHNTTHNKHKTHKNKSPLAY